jgi:hypothetical protein
MIGETTIFWATVCQQLHFAFANESLMKCHPEALSSVISVNFAVSHRTINGKSTFL